MTMFKKDTAPSYVLLHSTGAASPVGMEELSALRYVLTRWLFPSFLPFWTNNAARLMVRDCAPLSLFLMC